MYSNTLCSNNQISLTVYFAVLIQGHGIPVCMQQHRVACLLTEKHAKYKSPRLMDYNLSWADT